MKIKLGIQRRVNVQPDVLEEKINKYLKNNFYREAGLLSLLMTSAVIENGLDQIIIPVDIPTKVHRIGEEILPQWVLHKCGNWLCGKDSVAYFFIQALQKGQDSEL